MLTASVSRAEVTSGVQLVKEQNQYDRIPADLFSQLERILFFADKVADELVCKETEILEKTIPQMFEVMQDVAKVACVYVKRQYGAIFSACGGTDGHRENVGWANPWRGDRGYGQKVGRSHRRL